MIRLKELREEIGLNRRELAEMVVLGYFSLKNRIRGESLIFAKNGEKMSKNELRG